LALPGTNQSCSSVLFYFARKSSFSYRYVCTLLAVGIVKYVDTMSI